MYFDHERFSGSDDAAGSVSSTISVREALTMRLNDIQLSGDPSQNHKQTASVRRPLGAWRTCAPEIPGLALGRTSLRERIIKTAPLS
ncbi:hypothetical protein EVAR_2627_1 [Eumeta japonica]|uniref:Uncharacterized protein n=1 Tax=Eumeta variegata TaxID=151549 RepID=A0A4C1SPM0_EUMVA|nr:hypothetical protein EVAR_2627_1 [Eumeta japonica]